MLVIRQAKVRVFDVGAKQAEDPVELILAHQARDRVER